MERRREASAAEQAPGSRPPPNCWPPGHLPPAPRKGRGSSSSSAPRATAGEAARSKGSKPPKPGPNLAPLPPLRADAGRPIEMDGATGRRREPLRRRFDTLLRRIHGPPPTVTGHLDRPEAGGPRALPSRRFQALLTLFSESFSSFPRGTCSLSVSRQYLALDGIYHPFRAAFPNNPTRRQRLVE